MIHYETKPCCAICKSTSCLKPGNVLTPWSSKIALLICDRATCSQTACEMAAAELRRLARLNQLLPPLEIKIKIPGTNGLTIKSDPSIAPSEIRFVNAPHLRDPDLDQQHRCAMCGDGSLIGNLTYWKHWNEIGKWVCDRVSCIDQASRETRQARLDAGFEMDRIELNTAPTRQTAVRPATSTPTDPLDVEYDGYRLRELLHIDECNRRSDGVMVSRFTPAQRSAISAHWSAELRAKVAAAKQKEQVVVDRQDEP